MQTSTPTPAETAAGQPPPAECAVLSAKTADSGQFAQKTAHLRPSLHRPSLHRAALITVGIGLLLTLPTDILPNPIFGRAVPVRWWEYVAVGATLALTFAWFALPAAPKDPQSGRLGTLLGATLFAVACPVCNKIVLLLVGTSGAMGFWAPAQPWVALAAVAALALALWLRVRRPACTAETCG